ncbi:MAG: MFS transporter [Cellulosilyticaceae bacterium]
MSNNPYNKTISGRIDTMKVGGWHWRLVFLCMIGVMIVNYGLTSLPMAMPLVIKEWGLKPFMIGTLMSASSLGLLIGAFVFGALADVIGRKKALTITTLIFAIGIGISTFANNFTTLYIIRVIVGLGLGGFIPVAQAYVSEFAPFKVRGRFMGIFSIGNGVGYVLAVVMVMILGGLPNGWRWTFALCAVLGLVFIPFAWKMLHESVRYYLTKKDYVKALEIVEDIERRVLGQITVPREEALDAAQKGQGVLKQAKARDLFTKELIKNSILAIIIAFITNYTFYGFIQWLPTFLTKEMGYTITSGYTFTLIAAIVGTGTPGLAVGFLSDAIGRKKTLMLCMVAYAIVGFVFLAFGGWWILPLYWFSSAMSSQLYVYTPELFPAALRGTGLGLAGSIGRIAGFIAPMAIGAIVQGYGLTGVFCTNGVILVVGAIIVLVMGVETKKMAQQ